MASASENAAVELPRLAVLERNGPFADLLQPVVLELNLIIELVGGEAGTARELGGPPKGRVPVDFAKLRVPIDGHPRGLPLEEVTVQQIRAATRALSPKHAAKTSPVVAELTRALSGVAARKEVGVGYSNGYVSLRVPARVFVEVMRALAKAKVPTGETK